MLTAYLNAAMRAAHYELIDGGTPYYGEIPGFQGVYANAATLEACREELLEVLEAWVLLRVSRGLALPSVDGHELLISEIA